MISSLYFQSLSFAYMIILATVFFSKKKLRSIENSIFTSIIIINIVGLILDIWSTYLAYVDVSNPLLNPLCKVYLLYLICKCLVFTIYVIYVSSTKSETTEKQKRLKFANAIQMVTTIMIGLTIVIFMIPLYNFSEGQIIYTYGPAADFTFAIVGICVVIWIFNLIRNFKNIREKKYLPIIALVLCIISVGVLQKLHPELLLVTSMCCFITFLMYFTIENPDLKLISELNFAKDQADKANNAKSDFLSSMSHEIRTPLNAIVGFAQILSEKDLSKEARADVKDIVIAADNLIELVNSILDISKIEANKLEIINTKYNFKELLEELVLLAKGRLGDKPLELKTNFAPDIPDVLYGDKTRLKQIILNLLTNSVKYTKEGHIDFSVNVILKNNTCRLFISVEDTGIGIKKENIDKLFTKFQRFEERNTTIEGTGLGLAITKKLVELMDGQIVVQSVYGKGSKFTVAISQKIIAKKEIVSEKQTNKIEVEKSVIGKKVLIVDDNIVNLKVAAKLLGLYGLITEEVDSGFECIEKIKQKSKYDLILLDDMMPKMSGIETLKELKQIEDFDIPVVALTANALSGMKEKYLEEGFNDYLSKPIDKPELIRVINTFLSKK